MKIKFLAIVASLLLVSACVKNLEDEGVSIDNVTHFSYGGYTYQVHKDLGLMNWNNAQSRCGSLVAYGYDDWFMPSMGEMQAAHDAGLKWVEGWTSTLEWWDSGYTPYYYCFNGGYFVGEYSFQLRPIYPMRKSN